MTKLSCDCYSRLVRAPGDEFQLRNWSQLVQQRKKVEGIAFGLYDIHSSATHLMREEADLSVHTYASKAGRKSDRFWAYSSLR